MLPWNGEAHFVYTSTAGTAGLRYVRYATAAPYAMDAFAEQVRGETIALGGLGTFFSADAATGYLYLTGSDRSGGIGVLISRDNGTTWHDFAETSGHPAFTVYATGGAREVTADGSIIGEFTDVNTNDAYFIRVNAER